MKLRREIYGYNLLSGTKLSLVALIVLLPLFSLLKLSIIINITYKVMFPVRCLEIVISKVIVLTSFHRSKFFDVNQLVACLILTCFFILYK